MMLLGNRRRQAEAEKGAAGKRGSASGVKRRRGKVRMSAFDNTPLCETLSRCEIVGGV